MCSAIAGDGQLSGEEAAAHPNDGPHKMPGWTRLCHSDLTTGGSPLNWDWSMDEVRALARRATRVRIQTKEDPEEAVVSKPDTYPIENIRRGNPIGFERGLDEVEVSMFWESTCQLLLARLLHVSDCWRDHGHKEEVCNLETNVYWAACNGQGLHWHGLVHDGHLHPTCTWNNKSDSDLELYVDAELEDQSACWGVEDVLIRDLSGSEVAALRVPSHETIGQLKKRLRGRCAVSVYTQRLMHQSSEGALDDGVHLRELQHPVELQLVRLPLDSNLGIQLREPAFSGDVRAVERLLRNCASPNEPHLDGMTPLMLASQGGHTQVVRSLCAAGADRDRATAAGVTPLWIAATMGHLEVVRFLTEAGADRSAAFENGAAPLHVAAHNGHFAVVHFLSQAGEELDRPMLDGGTALQRASQGGHLQVVRFLCEAKADKDRPDRAGWTPLLLAAHGGRLEAVRCLCQASANHEQAFRDGSTPLIMAAATGQLEVLGYLCQEGVDKDTPRSDGATALHMAAKLGNLTVVRCLCEARADVEKAPPSGITALFIAAAKGHLEVAQQLHEAGAATDRRMENGATPLLLASSAGHADIVQFLCGAGASTNTPQRDGRTPLLMAAEAGHLEVVQLLCEAGANKDLSDHNGWTPLLAASRTRHEGVAQWLRSAGALEDTRAGRYALDNSRLQQPSPGVGYRLSKDLADRTGSDLFAAWGTTIIGVDEGDGWLRVGTWYLPMALQNVPVLIPTSQDE